MLALDRCDRLLALLDEHLSRTNTFMTEQKLVVSLRMYRAISVQYMHAITPLCVWLKKQTLSSAVLANDIAICA